MISSWCCCLVKNVKLETETAQLIKSGPVGSFHFLRHCGFHPLWLFLTASKEKTGQWGCWRRAVNGRKLVRPGFSFCFPFLYWAPLPIVSSPSGVISQSCKTGWTIHLIEKLWHFGSFGNVIVIPSAFYNNKPNHFWIFLSIASTNLVSQCWGFPIIIIPIVMK